LGIHFTVGTSYERTASLSERKMSLQAYQTSQYVMPRGGIFLGKWRSTFAGSYAQSACVLNILNLKELEIEELQTYTYIYTHSITNILFIFLNCLINLSSPYLFFSLCIFAFCTLADNFPVHTGLTMLTDI
jgi:hypothetical protein